MRLQPSSHVASLDGVRGIAISLVLAAHLAVHATVLPATHLGILLRFLFTPGWCGVDLFFALSGFLITGGLLDSKGAPNYFSSFYAKRFLRIFPLYYATLLIVFAVVAAAPDLVRISSVVPAPRNWWAYFAYLQNWPSVFQDAPRRNILGHFWSLAVEEQFYLIWPLCVWLFGRRALFRLCCAGFAGALLWRCLLVSLYGGQTFILPYTGSRMDSLFAGAALAITIREGWPITGRTLRLLTTTGAAIVLFIAICHPLELIATGRFMQTIGVTGFALLSAALVGAAVSGRGRVLEMRPFRALGKYSYGIYVLHQPVFILLSIGRSDQTPKNIGTSFEWIFVAISISIGLAVVSYEFYEKRFLVLKKKFAPMAGPSSPFGNTPHLPEAEVIACLFGESNPIFRGRAGARV